MEELFTAVLRPFIVYDKLIDKYDLTDDEIDQLNWNYQSYYNPQMEVLTIECYHSLLGTMQVEVTKQEFLEGLFRLLKPITTKAKRK